MTATDDIVITDLRPGALQGQTLRVDGPRALALKLEPWFESGMHPMLRSLENGLYYNMDVTGVAAALGVKVTRLNLTAPKLPPGRPDRGYTDKVSTWVSPAVRMQAEKIAAEYGVSRSAVLREAILGGLDDAAASLGLAPLSEQTS